MSSSRVSGSYTGTIASGNTLTIQEDDNVVAFTVLCLSGTCSITGSEKFQGNSSTPITLSAGQSFTKMAPQYGFLKQYKITASGGSTAIDIQK